MWNPFSRVVDAEALERRQEERGRTEILARVADGLANAMAGLGTKRDKRSFSEWQPTKPLSRVQLGNMWRSSWVAKKGIKIPVEDAFAEWLKVQWDGSEADTSRQQKFDEWEKRFDVRTNVVEGNWWGRLYGGGITIVGLKGETDLSQPLEIESIRQGSLDYLYTIDRWQCGPTDLMNQPYVLGSPNFGKPRFYALGSVSVPSSRVHWSRCLVWGGERLPWFEWLQNGMWDDSSLQHVYDDVRDHGTVLSLLATMFFEANIDVMAIEALATTLALPKGKEKIVKRFQDAAEMKSANRMLLIDAKDKYEKKGNNFQGLAPVSDVFKSNLIAAFDIPATRFYGESPGGLNSTGAGDMDNYKKRLRGDQTSKYGKNMDRLYQIACMDLFGEVPPGFKTEWGPLEQETELETSQRQLNNANRDKIYMDGDGSTPAVPAYVVTRQLKEDDVYSVLEDGDIDDVEAMSERMDAQRAAALLGPAPGAQPAGAKSIPAAAPVGKGAPTPSKAA